MSTRRRPNRAKNSARAANHLVDLNALASDIRPSEAAATLSSGPAASGDEPAPGPPPRKTRAPAASGAGNGGSETSNAEKPVPTRRQGAVQPPRSVIGHISPTAVAEKAQEQPDQAWGAQESDPWDQNHAGESADQPGLEHHGDQWAQDEQNQEQKAQGDAFAAVSQAWGATQATPMSGQPSNHSHHSQTSNHGELHSHQDHHDNQLSHQPPQQRSQPPSGSNASRYAPSAPQEAQYGGWGQNYYPEQDSDHFRHQGSLPLPADAPHEEEASEWDAYTNIELEESQQASQALQEEALDRETERVDESQGHENQFWDQRQSHSDHQYGNEYQHQNEYQQQSQPHSYWDNTDTQGPEQEQDVEERDPWDEDLDVDIEIDEAPVEAKSGPDQHDAESHEAVAESEQNAPWEQQTEANEEENDPWDQQELDLEGGEPFEGDEVGAADNNEQTAPEQPEHSQQESRAPWESEEYPAETETDQAELWQGQATEAEPPVEQSAPWDQPENETVGYSQEQSSEYQTRQHREEESSQQQPWEDQYQHEQSWNPNEEAPQDDSFWDQQNANAESATAEESTHPHYGTYEADQWQTEQQGSSGDAYEWNGQTEEGEVSQHPQSDKHHQDEDSQTHYPPTQDVADEGEVHQEEAAPWDQHNEARTIDDVLGDDDLEMLDDDDDFLGDSVSPPGEAEQVEEATQYNYDTVIHHPADEQQEDEGTNKSKALELLDLDEDLLLDEEFLEDEPEISASEQQQIPEPTAVQKAIALARASVPASEPAQSKYAPSQKYAPTAPASTYAPPASAVPTAPVNPYASQPPAQPQAGRVTAVKPTGPTIAAKKPDIQPSEAASKFMTQIKEQDKLKAELNAAKKKNDAYDFPINLVKAPSRAPRAAHKSGPSSVASPPSRPIPLARASHSTTSSQAETSTVSGPEAQQQQPEKKQFFEEYPTNVVKPPTRAGRAAASSYTPKENKAEPVRNISGPQASQPLPAKSPKNPYATLQPKVPSHISHNIPHASQPPAAAIPPANKYQPHGSAPQISAQPPLNPAGVPYPPAQPVGLVPPPGQQATNIPMSPVVQHQLPPQVQGGQAFPAMRGVMQGQSAPQISVNTALPGRPKDKNSTTSPYVPVSGPYAPSARGHSRTSSIVGGTAKEGNPYAPVADAPRSSLSVKNAVPQPGFHSAGVRERGSSLNKGNKSVSKVQNPNSLLERQFPVFHWNNGQTVAYLVPQQSFTTFDPVLRSLHVKKVAEVAKNHDHYSDFPGPLNKGKSKKKDIEAWLQKTVLALEAKNPASEEAVLAKVLYLLVKFDGDFKNKELLLEVAKVLTPNVDFSQEDVSASSAVGGSTLSLNAHKLDSQGVNVAWNLIQIGQTEEALSFALKKGDWALGFIIASSIGPERFAKVASDYARMSFPFQKGQGVRVQHLMPILMKIFVGNSASVINDFEHVASEGEFAKTHYKEIISAAIVNNCSTEFLVDFGKFLSNSGMDSASELCFILGGLLMTPTPLNNGATFQAVGQFTSTSVYSEIYEFILQTSPATSSVILPTGLPHLLPFKLRRAQMLADFGMFSEARRYCDHLGSVFKSLGKSPYLNPAMTTEFQNLLIRLSDSGASDSSWLGGKFSKVNLDKMWGQLDKIIGGETATPKNQDTGVFSKFSPSVSRNASTLDITQMAHNGPPFRPELNRSASLASAPAGHTSFSPMQSEARPHPSRYAPGGTGSLKKVPPTLSAQPSYYQPGFTNNAAQQPKYVSNGSSNSVNALDPSLVQDEHKPSMRQNTSFAPRQPPAPRNPLYSNRSGQLSSSSLGSHVSPQQQQQGNRQPNAQPDKFVLPDFNDNEGPPVMERSPRGFEKGHFRTSSLQSEVQDGVDGIDESQIPPTIAERSEESSQRASLSNPEDKNQVKETVEEQSEGDKRGENDQETTEEKLQPGADEEDKKSDTTSKPIDSEESKAVAEEPKKESEESLPPPPISAKRNVPQRTNPYAPGGARGTQSRNANSNRYGPGAARTTNRYALPSQPQQREFLEESTPNVSTADALGNEEQNGEDISPPRSNVPETEETEDERKPAGEAKEKEKPPTASEPPKGRPTGPPAGPSSGPSVNRRPNPYAPPGNSSRPAQPIAPATSTHKSPVISNANVDISMDYIADESTEAPESSQPQLPRETNSPAVKSPYANPFPVNKGPGEGLEEFSIPGSPEYTTRANSVIGNNGLFSSKLSQSQQSVLYQQYEVKDDTVHDYVPVPEDDDDDDEEEKAKKNKRRKEQQAREEENARKAAAREQERNNRAAPGNQQSESWLNRLRGKKDDKPKPIKAKLGVENTFVYDEEHKRWIDKSRPLEEQLKSDAPPPPPQKRRIAPAAPGVASSSEPSQPSSAPSRSEAPSATPSVAGRPSPAPGRPNRNPATGGSARPDLTNASMDDLLSMNSQRSGAGGRRPKRRYVNAMPQGNN